MFGNHSIKNSMSDKSVKRDKSLEVRINRMNDQNVKEFTMVVTNKNEVMTQD